MSVQTRTLKLFWYSFIYLFVTVAVIAAVLLTIARVWLPSAENYKGDIERWVGQVLEQQVEIESLDADWYGFEPQLVLKKVQFLSGDGQSIISAFDRVKVGFDLFSSVLRQAPVPGALVIEGARIVLVRQPDGSISVSGFGSQTPGDENNAAGNKVIEDWLLSQRLLKIENSSLVWRDLYEKNKTQLFSDVNLTLRNEGSRHQIEGSVFLPQDLGSHVLFFLDLRGNVFSSKDWSGNIQVTGVGLELVNWLDVKRFQNLELVNGVVSFSSWARVSGAKLEEVRGEVLASNLQIRSLRSRRLNKIDSISSDFSAQVTDNDWRITAEQLLVVHANASWPRLRLDIDAKPKQNIYEIEASQLDLNRIARLLTVTDVFSGELGLFLRQSRPRGTLENLTVFLHHDENNKYSFATGGRFRHLHLAASKAAPGIEDISGEFEWSNADGYVWLDTDDWALDHRSMFKVPRLFERLSGSLSWQKLDNGWRLDGHELAVSDTRANAHGRFTLTVEDNKAPFLDLAFGLKGKGITSVKKYLPDALMSPNLVSWIDTSAKSVTIAGGGLMYYGYVDQYPFDQGDGRFSLDLSLKDTKLQFLPDWPAINNISGNLEVTSLGLNFQSTGARVKNNKLENVSVVIPAFAADDAAVTIAGNIVGPTGEKLDYMYDSPLNDMFASHLKIFDARGVSDLALGINIPLADNEEDFFVAGNIAMKNNRLRSESIGLDLEHINGVLRFDDAGIYAEGLQAQFGPFNLEADIDTKNVGNGPEIVFTQQGMLKEQQMAWVLDQFVGQPQLEAFIKGDANARVDLFIPVSDQSAHREITLKAISNLQGVSLKLPEPFAKDAGELRDFGLIAELSGTQRELVLRIGDLETKMQFASAGGELRLDRGAVGMGVDVTLPTENAFHFTGKLSRFYWSEWEPLLIPEEGQPGLLQDGGGASSVYFDVSIAEAEILDAKFNDVNVQASSTVQGWAIHANGPQIQGSVYLPLVWETAPIVVDAKKLHVSHASTSSDDSLIDPAVLPAIRFDSENFRFNNIRFGKTSFESSRITNGIKLDRFKSSSNLADVQSLGSWTSTDNVHRSEFNIRMQAKDFGKTMDSFGFTDALKKGNGNLNIDASWDGAPVDFSFSTLTGKLEVDMQNVRLVDLNIGAAKMLGLLSLESIPRRLFFDFRDVVQKGMVFDNVQGGFDVQNGEAYSSGIILTGPTARMGIAGRIGLEGQDYDLVITFIPKTLESLPVIGGIASTVGVANPVLGAGLYVVQKLFQSQVDELSALQYTVVGSWQSPVVTQVKASSKVPEETEFVDEQ